MSFTNKLDEFMQIQKNYTSFLRTAESYLRGVTINEDVLMISQFEGIITLWFADYDAFLRVRTELESTWGFSYSLFMSYDSDPKMHFTYQAKNKERDMFPIHLHIEQPYEDIDERILDGCRIVRTVEKPELKARHRMVCNEKNTG